MAIFNSRVDSHLDPSHDHAGPHVWDKRQTIADPDRDNECSLSNGIFQSHLLILLQTFSSVEDKSKVTYKEMTPRQDSLTCQQPAHKMAK